MHRFEWINGKLHHYINEELRAVVTPDNVAAYGEATGLEIPAQ